MKRTASLFISALLGALTLAACESAPSAKPAATPPPAETPEQKAERLKVVERAKALLATQDTSPGREFVNRLRTEPNPAMLELFAKPDAVIPPDIRWRLGEINNSCQLAEDGKSWPIPPLAQVPHAAGAITLDGSLDDPAWKNALAYDRAFIFNSKTEPATNKTKWKMVWDEKYLYIAYECDDADLQAQPRKRDEAVYADDCVELFISNDIRFRSYWEIVGNINEAIFDSLECKKATQWGADLDMAATVEGLKFAVKTRGTINKHDDKDEGYTAELAVPWSAILPQKNTPKPGDFYHFMLVRVDANKAGGKAYSYQPLLGWGHNIWNMAKMELMPAK